MTNKTLSVNRRLFLGGAATSGALTAFAGGLMLASGSAQATAPLAGAPLSGVMRRKVGSFEVTALLDGYLDVEKDLVIGYQDDEAARLRGEAFVKGNAVRIPVSAFLVNTGDKLILIDAGTSGSLGPTLGHLGNPLAAAGVTPDQIDAVLITHMHPDHLFGVVRNNDQKMFANAELILPEADNVFWFDDANLTAAPEALKGFFLGARKASDVYKDSQSLFSGEKEIVPGIRPLSLPGHTPGHTGFVLDSEGETLIVAGDILHLAPYQFAHPGWGIAFDVDPEEASATRKRFFDQAASEKVMFAGAHVPFPGFGHVAREGDAYRYVAADWPYAF